MNTNQIGNDKAKDPAIGNRGFKKILALLFILCFYIARKKIIPCMFTRDRRERLKIDVYQLPRLKITFGANEIMSHIFLTCGI